MQMRHFLLITPTTGYLKCEVKAEDAFGQSDSIFCSTYPATDALASETQEASVRNLRGQDNNNKYCPLQNCTCNVVHRPLATYISYNESHLLVLVGLG